MRRTITFVGILLILAAAVAMQISPPEEVGKGSDLSFAYDWTGLDIEGDSDQVDAAEFIFRSFPPVSPPLTPVRIIDTRPVIIGTTAYPVAPLLENITDGEYTLTVRIRDLGGNWSEESAGIQILVTSKNPSRPTNLRVVGR